MSKLYVIRRTESEIQIFGGTVFIDIDGKRVGEISRTDLVIDLEPGTHNIKMYKTHTYDTFIGFADVTITVEDGKDLTARYSAPMTIHQPGHIVISDFVSLTQIDNQIKQKEIVLREEKRANDLQAQQREEESQKNNNALIFWIVVVPIIIGLIYFFVEMAYIDSLF